jgi:transcriptional regulator with XRE-family HTH domain
MAQQVDLLIMATKQKIGNPAIHLLAKRIKSLRISKGYTSYEYFAYDHGFSRSQFGRYEKGEDIRFSSLIKLIEAFEMTPEEFFSEGFEPHSKRRKK